MREHPVIPRRVVGVLLVLCAIALAVLLTWSIGDGLLVGAALAGCGLAAIIVLGGALSVAPVDSRSEATERTLRVATNTLSHLRGGLTVENARALCALLLPETNADGIAITDRARVLAYEGSIKTPFVAGTANARPTLEVLESGRMETFVSVDEDSQDVRGFSMGSHQDGHAFGIIVPLAVQERTVGAIKFYYRRDLDIDRT